MTVPDYWTAYERRIPWVFATLAAVVGVSATGVAGWAAVDTWLLGPTVVLFFFWAALRGFPAWLVYIAAGVMPIVVNLVDSDRGEEVSMFLVVLAVSMAAAFEPRRRLVTTYVVTLLAAIVLLSLVGALEDFGWPNWVFGLLFSWGFGETVFRLRQSLEELKDTRALVADQAALQERRRIARDVHDLVGHSLSVVMLQVTGARHLIRRDPAEAERALAQAEATGKQSLAEIRQTVGLLRDETEAGSPAAPSPDLNDLDELVAEFTAVGVDARLTLAPGLDEVEPAVAVAGYRIVQEALTNAARHAAGGQVEVEVAMNHESCELAVRSIGGRPVADVGGSGVGLVGMRERAKSVSGSLTAGPTRTGWLVEASLPVQIDRGPS